MIGIRNDMNLIALIIRQTLLRLKFAVADTVHNLLWMLRSTLRAVALAPVVVVRVVVIEAQEIVFGLLNALRALARFVGSLFHADGLYNAWYGLRATLGFLLRLPLHLGRFLLHEWYALTHGVRSGGSSGWRMLKKILLGALYTIFIAPIAWVIPLTSPRCCNATLARSRPRGREIYVRRFLLIGTYRCRFCSKRCWRFWPVVDRQVDLADRRDARV
jgi:hypothetical protein